MEAWICDVNGVLVDSTALVQEAFAATGARHGFTFTGNDFHKVKGLSLADAYRLLDPGSDQVRRRRYHVGYLRERIETVRTFPDVAETLAAANAAGLRVGATTSCGEIAEASLVHTGLYRFIDCLVTQEEVRRSKPDPECVRLVMTLLGVRGSNVRSALHVGDSPFDIEAGRAAGVRTIGVTYGVSGTQELAAARPDHLLHSFGDMRRFLPVAAPSPSFHPSSGQIESHRASSASSNPTP